MKFLINASRSCLGRFGSQFGSVYPLQDHRSCGCGLGLETANQVEVEGGNPGQFGSVLTVPIFELSGVIGPQLILSTQMLRTLLCHGFRYHRNN